MDAPPASPRIAFDNSYARLPERFFARMAPTPVAAPRLIRVNAPLAERLGLDPAWLSSPEGVAMLAGNALPPGAEPIAQAYAGHQFGHFVPQLGDGRAVLLGELLDASGARFDLQLKGAGPTPFSRRGDGRAALGPVLREYVVSEAMAALGVPTTRALAAVTTGEEVYRETPLPGAVFARVASSHIRIGTFQFFAARRDVEAIGLLVEHALARHEPAALASPNRAHALLEGVVARQAALIARWLLIGFVHGVMNTDNTTISGETIDFGPCAFLDAYDSSAVFSSIDQGGRYAYGQQPNIALWNLTRLAECLLPLLHPEEERAIALAQEVLAGFAPRFTAAYREGLARKLGLAARDDGLADAFLGLLAEGEADFTLAFRFLADATTETPQRLTALFRDPAALAPWLARWRARRGRACARGPRGTPR
jgi:serine/tyrosine/threonine adenylyltransferase